MAKIDTAGAVCFDKQQLLASKRYAGRKDLLGALLAEGTLYTLEDVDALIENYLKGVVE